MMDRGDKPNPASHWKTNYQQNVDEATSTEPSRSIRPMWSLPRAAYSSKRSYFHTEYNKSMGTYGHNPRNKLNGDTEKIDNENHELTMGTTKVTKHIPGYNGYLPKTDLNTRALSQAALDGNRNTIVKQNIVENYQVKLPGYSGHKPMSTTNDRGMARPACLNTQGESFI